MIKNIKNLTLKKKDGGKEILIELGLAIVGVVLLIMYKQQISTFLTTITTRITTEITNLFN
jgi:uncharacterized alkaline shock family protein YloU